MTEQEWFDEVQQITSEFVQNDDDLGELMLDCSECFWEDCFANGFTPQESLDAFKKELGRTDILERYKRHKAKLDEERVPLKLYACWPLGGYGDLITVVARSEAAAKLWIEAWFASSFDELTAEARENGFIADDGAISVVEHGLIDGLILESESAIPQFHALSKKGRS